MTPIAEPPRLERPGAHRRRLVAFGLYAAAALTLIGAGTMSLTAAFDDDAWLADNRDRGRALAPRPAPTPPGGDPAPAAGALVGAKTVGVAAASLQQRVEAAAREVGAKTLSSRVDPQSASAANGALAYVGEIELDAAVLQRLLYNIEAGTPFLEIDDLSIRPLRDAEAGERLRVSLAVTAYWRPSP
jgi:general secretion pathway protein M